MTEEWKDVKGYEGFYQASNYGNVRGVDRIVKRSLGAHRIQHGVKIKQFLNNDGYPTILFHKDGLVESHNTHRVVALHFIENEQNKPEINHLDENKLNNRIDNLEWVTRKENMNWGTLSERMSKKVVQTDKDGNIIKIWCSAKNISDTLEYDKNKIRIFCRKKQSKPLYGFYWEFVK